MIARTHDAFAFASLVTFASYYPPQSLNVLTLFSSLIGNIVGGLLPDIDQAGNRLWDLLPAGNFLGKILRRLFLSHRALSHSFLGLFLFYKLLEWILPKLLNPGYVDPKIVMISIMLGYISHLFADSLTEEGLPFLFPIRIKIGFPPISSWRIKTGGWFEKFVIFPGVGIYLFWFITANQDRILNLIKLISK